MATVRERAAALDLAKKLYSPMHLPTGKVKYKPFQSSVIWRQIISHLQAEVKVKRRRHYLKSHSNCFLGSDAVNVIHGYINQNKILGNMEVPRAKVVRVCQALLDCRVFEAVASRTFGKESKLRVFQDSDGSLYRFLSTTHNSPLLCSAENTLLSPDEQRKAHRISLSLSLSLSLSVVSKVWQEQTVQRLLQLIELPILDGLLDCKEYHPTQSGVHNNEPDLLFTSNYLEREILKAFKESKEEWLSAALDLLDFLPDQQVVEMSRELPRCKALLFDILAKHYGQANPQPLLPTPLNDVYTQITELLVNGKAEAALEVLQLCLKLLPAASREELYRLLGFMSLAADPQHIRLHKEVENRMMVKKTFGRAIIQSKSLPKGKVDLLLLFMLDNHEDIFKVPKTTFCFISVYMVYISWIFHRNAAFCQQISSNLYKETVKELTNSELFVLLRNIDENPSYSMKEKNRLLAQFYKGHPDIFAQYFGSRLCTINLLDV
uniref:DEP domain-containing protein 7 n=1 Tax=Electrophorus electricus TaxID=8005 RepID=A0A4W4GMN9_ELEEL